MTTLPDVVLALAKAASPVPIGDGRAPAGVKRWAVAYFDDGALHAEDVAHTSDLVIHSWQLTYVARGDQAVRSSISIVRAAIRGALIDVVPVVPGWVFGPIELDLARPTIPDPDVPGEPALFAVDLFSCRGSRA